MLFSPGFLQGVLEMLIYKLIGNGLLPDFIIRQGIRNLLARKLKEEESANTELELEKLQDFVEQLKASPIAVEVHAANKQHYELPAEFFQLVLGPHLKYSSGYFYKDEETLSSAETNMLELYCQRARLEDGQEVLDLGCGWGSFSLYAAARYPGSKFTAVSNSKTQKAAIQAIQKERGIENLEVITADVSVFDTERQFDRVVSVEMFEHMKNYRLLLKKVSKWLREEGLLFVHIFSHVKFAYHYENKDGNDWLTENFFTGGTMPSDSLLLYFQEDVRIENHWRVSGKHYEKTANAWLLRMDENRDRILPIMDKTYGQSEGKSGSTTGDYFSWPVRNSGAMKEVRNG
mgnify:CR=1 FL=1